MLLTKSQIYTTPGCPCFLKWARQLHQMTRPCSHRIICPNRRAPALYQVGSECRGLSVVPDLGVVSASHDQTLRLWSFAGETLAELVGHAALVYSAAAHASTGLIASASEDSTARLWHGDGSCVQSLPHPRELPCTLPDPCNAVTQPRVFIMPVWASHAAALFRLRVACQICACVAACPKDVRIACLSARWASLVSVNPAELCLQSARSQ